MPAQLVDLDKEFDLGNLFTLNVAERLTDLLSDEYRVIVKYDRAQPLPVYSDDKLNVGLSTSRETHEVPGEFFREDVFAIILIVFKNYLRHLIYFISFLIKVCQIIGVLLKFKHRCYN